MKASMASWLFTKPVDWLVDWLTGRSAYPSSSRVPMRRDRAGGRCVPLRCSLLQRTAANQPARAPLRRGDFSQSGHLFQVCVWHHWYCQWEAERARGLVGRVGGRVSRETKKERTVWIRRGLLLFLPAEGSVCTPRASSAVPRASLGPAGGSFCFNFLFILIFLLVLLVFM